MLKLVDGIDEKNTHDPHAVESEKAGEEAQIIEQTFGTW